LPRAPRGVGGLVVVGLLAVGILLVVGWLSRSQLAPSHSEALPPAGGTFSSPTTTAPDVPHLAFQEPIDALAATPGAVWVAHAGSITRVDQATMRGTATVSGYQQRRDRPVVGLAAGSGAVWASVHGVGVLRIDPASARVIARIPVMTEAPPAVGADGIWVVCCGAGTRGGDGRLSRIDPATNRIVTRIRLPGRPDAVGAGIRGVWVRGALGPVWHVDPATNLVVASVRVPGGLGGQAGSVLVGPDAVWVSDPNFGRVLRIDPAGQRLDGNPLESRWRDLGETADGSVWSGGLALRPGRLSHATALPGRYGSDVVALAAGPATVWIATDTAELVRLDPRPAP
jgi:DNA-binding beta-propeller fold protein YncE